MEINQKTFVDYGMPISKNFILEHLTSGAWHPILGQIIPFKNSNIFTTQFQNIPIWKIVDNLSTSSGSILEPLLKEFGGLLNVQQGFNSIIGNNSEILHKIGSGLDISIKGFEADMSYVAKDIQRIANKASGLNLVYGSSSHIHIDADPDYIKRLGNATKIELPKINSIDEISGITEQGIFNLRTMF